MIQFIALIPVDNSLEIGREDIDCYSDSEKIDCVKRLRRKSDNEYPHIYNMSSHVYTGQFRNIEEFTDDYNNEDYDGGFWMIEFSCESEDKLLELLTDPKTEKGADTNIKKYLDDATETENGCVYKVENLDAVTDDEIVYISEYGIEQLKNALENDYDLSDSQIIKRQFGDTKNTIRQTIKDYHPAATDEWIDKHDLIADLVQSCTWESIATMCDQMDNWDIWDDYPES